MRREKYFVQSVKSHVVPIVKCVVPSVNHFVQSINYFVQSVKYIFLLRFLDLADIIPKVKLEGDVRITKLEFRQMLERMNLYIENSEFEKLWCR